MGLSPACARATLVRPESAVSADHESMHTGDEYERLYGDAFRRDRQGFRTSGHPLHPGGVFLSGPSTLVFIVQICDVCFVFSDNPQTSYVQQMVCFRPVKPLQNALKIYAHSMIRLMRYHR